MKINFILYIYNTNVCNSPMIELFEFALSRLMFLFNFLLFFFRLLDDDVCCISFCFCFVLYCARPPSSSASRIVTLYIVITYIIPEKRIRIVGEADEGREEKKIIIINK